jgi:hypothetical protein
MITPYKINHENIISKINCLKLVFPLLENPKTRNLNLMKACCIHTHYINAFIQGKKTHLMHFRKDAFKKKLSNNYKILFYKKEFQNFKAR